MLPRLLHRLLLSLPIGLLLWGAGSTSTQAGTPIPVARGEAQFFVDDFLIDTQSQLVRTLHRPVKDDGGNHPVIALENEFGGLPGTLEANGTIVYDPRLKKYVMFAIAFSTAVKGPDRVRIYRFTSPDAMNWVKGDDGKPEHIRFDLLDARTGRSASNTDVLSCYYDTTDAEHPYKGWLWFANWGDQEGIYFVHSSDGRTWKRGPQVTGNNSHVIKQDGRAVKGPSDVTLFHHDVLSNRFLASIKFHTYEPVGPGNHLRSRAYAFVDSVSAPFDVGKVERIALLPAAAAANGDLPHDEYYGSTGWRYESLWLGGLKIWHGGGDYPYSAAGCAFLKLAVSRDGLNWSKVQFANDAGEPEVFIPNGPEGGNEGRNDGGYMTEFSQGPLRIDDELIFYYGSSSFGKNEPTGKRVSGGGIFRARLRPDGFVSVDRGTLTTKPLRFEGQTLSVNGVGPITVALLDANETVLGSAEITGDSLRHEISFGPKPLADLLRGNAARLRFTVNEGGRLYSFEAQ